MAVTPVYKWPIPNLTDVADGPDGFSDLANAIEATLTDTLKSTYTPSWTSSATNPANPASRAGWYRVENAICDFVAQLTFGASTSGSYGDLSIGLPVPASAVIPRQICGTVILLTAGIVNNDRWAGYATTGNTDQSNCAPWFPVDATRNNFGRWSNADSSGSTESGVPNVDGAFYNIRNGGYIVVQGRYFTA